MTMLDYFQNLIANCASKWRPVVGYEGFYEVSSDGDVRSITRTVLDNRGRNRTRIFTGKSLRPATQAGTHPYYGVQLCKLCKPVRRYIHTIVAEAFLGSRPSGFVIDHIDGNSQNNSACNLRYCSQSLNMGKMSAKNRPFLGTTFDKRCNMYSAYINICHKRINLGYYETREAAMAARLAKEIELKGVNAPMRGDR